MPQPRSSSNGAEHRETGGYLVERAVIIFTEYRDTQKYLVDQLTAAGLAKGDRLKTLFGGQDDDEREAIEQRFRPILTSIRPHPLGDGHSVRRHRPQRQCHRLVHVEIPWNESMEQRNGRIDRHGQRATADIFPSLAPATKRPSQAASKRTLSSSLAQRRKSIAFATTSARLAQ